MPIQVGDTIPSVDLYKMSAERPEAISTDFVFSDKRVVVFAVPGAFTPTCSAAHLPGFVVKADEIRNKGIDAILCISVNDAWVMNAWGQTQNADAINMYADGSADFTDAIDLIDDRTNQGMGVRSRRYAMIVNDGVVEWIGVDELGKFEKSSAESVITHL